MMINEESIEILNFITPGTGVLCQGVAYSGSYSELSKTSLGDGSDKHKKTVLRICLLIPIILTGYIAAFSAIVDFYLFYNWAVDLTRSQCTVSDT